jgi:hypothetical protein
VLQTLFKDLGLNQFLTYPNSSSKFECDAVLGFKNISKSGNSSYQIQKLRIYIIIINKVCITLLLLFGMKFVL